LFWIHNSFVHETLQLYSPEQRISKLKHIVFWWYEHVFFMDYEGVKVNAGMNSNGTDLSVCHSTVCLLKITSLDSSIISQ